ncbi:autoinducer 2 ABC transporter substrate-binding protein [Nakamurella aerolata]|uniref:Autoinducer 2 ABC transporter substrate-binding protein n=1 Tax=Nakamurella aerolata TaxID=1656892 RepID=A0A849A8W6_9ACTN|nr:autoinducer 2 ABC transporter substrate-binding protein [Nakamurella aerolata]NNG36985.1 autoinducer 2 ABC transporter substrate-binding protein [Nakamurella aerolata]
MKRTRLTTAAITLGVAGALVLAGCTKKNEADTSAGAGGGDTGAATTTENAGGAAGSAGASAAGGAGSAAGSAAQGSAAGSGSAGAAGAGSVEKASKNFKVAFVPKLQGIPYFEAMNAGGKQAASDMGVTWLYQGPTQADAAAQADIVRNLIQQKVDALFIAPNDPGSMAPVIQQGIDGGIKVGTSDTDAPDSARQVFVSQASTEGIGQGLTDELMKAMGNKGKYAIVSCGETAENLNSWIKVQQAYTKEKYPDAEIVDVVYAGEDVAKATQMATDLMNANPDLTGLVGECTSSAPGVAQAVKDAGKIGKVFTVGLGTPQTMAPYLKDGSSSASVLWDVQALGYLTVWAGVQMAEGKEFAAKPEIGTDNLKDVSYDAATKTLLLGPPLVLTKDNVDNYNF